jgi:hypothetical protein
MSEIPKLRCMAAMIILFKMEYTRVGFSMRHGLHVYLLGCESNS